MTRGTRLACMCCGQGRPGVIAALTCSDPRSPISERTSPSSRNKESDPHGDPSRYDGGCVQALVQHRERGHQLEKLFVADAALQRGARPSRSARTAPGSRPTTGRADARAEPKPRRARRRMRGTRPGCRIRPATSPLTTRTPTWRPRAVGPAHVARVRGPHLAWCQVLRTPLNMPGATDSAVGCRQQTMAL